MVRACALAVGLASWAMACSGNEFSAGRGGAGSGGASGASSSGGGGGSAGSQAGSTSGGSDASGGTEGGRSGSANGGSSGAGGELNTGGTSMGGGGAAAFPATDVLDDFERALLGENWQGSALDYPIVEGELTCMNCLDAALWHATFGAQQEVFVTLAAFTAETSEINLVLAAQAPNCELIEVMYMPDEGRIIPAFCTGGVWENDFQSIYIELEPGHQLGARLDAEGNLGVYLNGDLLNSYDVSAFPHQGGQIGVNGVAAEGAFDAWDDFGGGDW
jgi:hypothetical protein